MSTSRKRFLKQSALILGGSLFARNKLFADVNELPLKHTLDCSFPCSSLKGSRYNSVTVPVRKTYGRTSSNYIDASYKYDYINEPGGNMNPCQANSWSHPNDYYCSGNNQTDNLFYDVYYPSNYDWVNGCPLPCIIYFHGGGFSDCSSLDITSGKPGVYFGQEFAKRGFVFMNCEYRRGRILDNDSPNKFTTVQQVLAIYRAFEDARGAIRTIIKRQIESPNADTFKIDINNIFLAGQSAGSAIAMNAAYYDQTMNDQIFSGLSPILGNMDTVAYYNNYPNYTGYDYHPNIRGVINMWGNVLVPLSYGNNIDGFFKQGNQLKYKIPMISFQGRQDSVAAYDYDYVYFSGPPMPGDPNNQTETVCFSEMPQATFTLPGLKATADLLTVGANQLYPILNNNNVFTEYYLCCQMQHGLRPEGIKFFGTDYDTAAGANIYLMERSATFMQRILTGYTSTLTRTMFVDCENNRFGCDPSSDCGSNKTCN